VKLLFIGEGRHDIGDPQPLQPRPAQGTIPTLARRICAKIAPESVALAWTEIRRFNRAAKKGYKAKVTLPYSLLRGGSLARARLWLQTGTATRAARQRCRKGLAAPGDFSLNTRSPGAWPLSPSRLGRSAHRTKSQRRSASISGSWSNYIRPACMSKPFLSAAVSQTTDPSGFWSASRN
jgi:hypothetical protein